MGSALHTDGNKDLLVEPLPHIKAYSMAPYKAYCFPAASIPTLWILPSLPCEGTYALGPPPHVCSWLVHGPTSLAVLIRAVVLHTHDFNTLWSAQSPGDRFRFSLFDWIKVFSSALNSAVTFHVNPE